MEKDQGPRSQLAGRSRQARGEGQADISAHE